MEGQRIAQIIVAIIFIWSMYFLLNTYSKAHYCYMNDINTPECKEAMFAIRAGMRY
jgi:hypothetical protein